MSFSAEIAHSINRKFGRNLIDLNFLKDFQKTYYYDFLNQIHYIRKMKSKDDKVFFIQELSNHANQLLSVKRKSKVNFSILYNSTKVTDTVFVLRQIILHNSDALRRFMDSRKTCYQKLKNHVQIQKQQMKIFTDFYEVILQGNQACSQSTQKQPIKMLIGIRKLLRQTKTTRKDVHDRRNKLYQTNRIIKQILQNSLALKKTYDHDQQFIASIHQLLNQKKWLGPNLFKLLRKYQWKGYQIDTLIDLMEESIKKQPRFNAQKIKNVLNRTLQNIKSYSKYLKENPNNTGQFRLISTISDGLSNVFSMQDIENIQQGFLFHKTTHQLGYFSSKIHFHCDSQILQDIEQ